MYPSGLIVNTPLGEFKLAVTDGRHAHASGLIVIRGIEYRYDVHLYLNADGTFGTRDSDRIYMRRTDSAWKNEASAAAERKANEVVLPALCKWCEEEFKTGTAFLYGHLSHARDEQENIEKEIEELRAKIVALENKASAYSPLPPDHRLDLMPLPDDTFETYKAAFVQEYKKAACADKCYVSDNRIRSAYVHDGNHEFSSVRQAAMEAVTEDEFTSAGFRAADQGEGKDENPHAPGTLQFELWQTGWEQFEEIRPVLEKIQAEKQQK